MFEELLSRIGSYLFTHNIPYIITGAQALLLYGVPRLARDIDVVLAVDSRCVNLILFTVQQLNLTPLPEDPRSFLREHSMLPALDEKNGIRIDFILSETTYEKEAIKRAVRIRIEDKVVFFATPEDLIIHKIMAGSFIDLEDCRELLAKNKDVDLWLIRRLLKEFDKYHEKGGLLAAFEEILRKARGRDIGYY